MEYIGKTRIINLRSENSQEYSDGEIEEEILEWVRSNEFNSNEILNNDSRWPVLYHFSKDRWNLLEWYPFKKDANLLEIGAGCGALTGLFCEKIKSVHALELSERRSKILANRHKNYSNLDVIIADINQFDNNVKYDYITLIGVLEYAGKFSNGKNDPYRSLLKKIKSLLKPNGVLLVAIENKFGLKYWSGSKEDHTGVFFDGIEGYKNIDGIKTFGLDELKELLNSVGFRKQTLYYPYPDYKLPQVIYSDDYLPKIGELFNCESYDSDRIVLFNELAVYNELLKERKFPFFSNSFLVEVTMGDQL